ncbi:hypothetical protein AB1Y20_018287 [Prymnesium parvum]|uniref:Uncharacterized protein n=1 Tax=Prymnesium parvum TaxID=97485 RepID=A0AB34JRB4_PRYPA
MADERERLRAFFAARPREESPSDSEDDDAELELVRQARLARQDAARLSDQQVAQLAASAEAAVAEGALMEGVAAYTRALELDPNHVGLLAARAAVCARLNLHQAALHDGELIVRLMPHWHHGHALCGMALYCLAQYAPAVRAYRRALEFSAASAAGEGVRLALEDARAKADAELRRAALRADVPTLLRLVQDGELAEGLDRRCAVELEAADAEHGFTPLILAAAAGRRGSVEVLLRARANVEAADRFGKTALCWAAAQGDEAMVAALLAHGAEPRAADQSGWDSLMAACHGGHVKVATVLSQRADLARAAADGSTCLHVAAEGGRVEVVRLLLRLRADAAAADRKGRRALELALRGASAAHAQVAELLRPLTPAAAAAPRRSVPAAIFVVAVAAGVLLALV